MSKLSSASLETLRQQIQKLDGSRREAGVLPFGVEAIDACLPGGGLALGALHEITGRDGGAVDGAAAALFAAGIAARSSGKVLWCVTRPDLFAPGLAQGGLGTERVVYVEAGDEKTLLACFEEGLRYGGVGAVVGEISRLSLVASRRLQLAAEGSATLGLALRRWGRERDAVEFGLPTAAVTRWRVTARPSVPLPVAGIGKAQWRLELMRCKGGKTAEFTVEACDAQGCLALSAPMADRPAATGIEQEPGRWRAAS